MRGVHDQLRCHYTAFSDARGRSNSDSLMPLIKSYARKNHHHHHNNVETFEIDYKFLMPQNQWTSLDVTNQVEF